MWSSEYDQEGFEYDLDSIVGERDGFYDRATRGITESDVASQVRERATAVVFSRFGKFLADDKLATVVSIGGPAITVIPTDGSSKLVAEQSRF